MEEARKKRRVIVESFWRAAYPFMTASNTKSKWSKKHVHMGSVAQSMALGLDFGDGMLCAGRGGWTALGLASRAGHVACAEAP